MAELPPKDLLQGRRILLVEDDYITAFDLKAELEGLGAEVLGPVSDLEGALEVLAKGPGPDTALLDINLGGEMVFPLADRLQERHIPFIFTTGYDGWALPEPYADLPRLEKPLDMRQLAQALTS
jgi:CheY-like chemotaxis protein